MTDAARPVAYERQGSIGVVTLDDGKVNALSPAMIAAINERLDTAEDDDVVLVLAGRTGCFSAGFDLRTLGGGGADAAGLVRSGFELSARLLAWPRPVVVACTGHAFAMASFLLLSADYRVGADGPFTIVANEVAIGLTMPRPAVEVCRFRLPPTYFHRAVLLSERFDPTAAIGAGFLDEVVAATDVLDRATTAAAALVELDARAFAATKQRTNSDALARLRRAIDDDAAEYDA
jgi:enoyl-CoA hydratase